MNTRLNTIADAAALLFMRQGYARTQIGHIAKAVGVSVGTIYLDFAGKKEILHFILKGVIDPEFRDGEFERPITDALFSNIEGDIASFFDRLETRLARRREGGASGYGLEDLVSDAFDLFSRYAVGCLFIEKNQFDFEALAAAYTSFRRRFIETVSGDLAAFIADGTMRPVERLDLVATFIIETLSWWAMDRRYTSFETSDIPLDLAKRICMDALISAYKR